VVSAAYLLDTDTIIELLRRSARPDRRRFAAARGRLAASSISLAELEYGSLRSFDPAASHQAVDSLLTTLQLLPFDRAAAEQAGRVRAELAAREWPIGPHDTLIAGHARSRGLILVTGNTAEFARVPGLMTENWLDRTHPPGTDQ
jgi:tRNA(fMet)-specific endonuclease VapC